MRALHADTGLAYLCQLLGKSRQAYYQGQKSKDNRLLFEALVAELVQDLRKRLDSPKLGTRKLLPLIQEELKHQELTIGRDHLFQIMEAYGLQVRQRRRKAPSTTDNTHYFRRYPNLIKGKKADRVSEVWVSDITYIRIQGDRFMYLSLITDQYSRKIVGYKLHEDLSTEGPLQALLMALTHRNYPDRALIRHSDQGIQYCSHDYVNTLKSNGIAISMASKGNPYENPLAERMNGILKHEYDLSNVMDSPKKAIRAVERAIVVYNSKRPHGKLSGQTPDQVHHRAHAMDILKTSLTSNGLEVSNIPTAGSKSVVNQQKD